jgi:adenosylcobinamide kinase/adenosylcobinamide-phosphate guanylyltransferase
MIRLFVMGGALGQSRYAQARAEETGLPRLHRHGRSVGRGNARADRPPSGRPRPAVDHRGSPLALPQALREASTQGRVVLVDCLTLWLTNLMLGEHDIPRARDDLIAAIEDAQGR